MYKNMNFWQLYWEMKVKIKDIYNWLDAVDKKGTIKEEDLPYKEFTHIDEILECMTKVVNDLEKEIELLENGDYYYDDN